MRWSIAILLAYLLLGIEIGARETLRYGDTGMIAPSFVVPLVVFVALWAPWTVSFWLGLGIGLMIDLLSPVPIASAGADGAPVMGGLGLATVIGPYALGFAMMTQFVHVVRGVVIRRNPVAVVVIVVLASMVASVVVASAWLLQGMTDASVSVSALGVLRDGFLSSLYTGVIAVVVAPVLMLLTPVMGFPTGPRAGRM